MAIAFLIGLLSSLHCLGMCSGLVGAMTMTLQPQIRAKVSHLALYTFAYNSGRVSSYMIAGLFAGLFGQALSQLIPLTGTATTLRVIAALLVISTGFYLGGWFSRLALIEHLGARFWQILKPFREKLLPVKNIRQAYLLGMLWGWLPCGLVYTVLLQAPAQSSVIDAMLYMFFFGIGTLIPMMSAGFLTGQLASIKESDIIKKIAASLLVFLGCWALLIEGFPEFKGNFAFHSVF